MRHFALACFAYIYTALAGVPHALHDAARHAALRTDYLPPQCYLTTLLPPRLPTVADVPPVTSYDSPNFPRYNTLLLTTSLPTLHLLFFSCTVRAVAFGVPLPSLPIPTTEPYCRRWLTRLDTPHTVPTLQALPDATGRFTRSAHAGRLAQYTLAVAHHTHSHHPLPFPFAYPQHHLPSTCPITTAYPYFSFSHLTQFFPH